MATIAELELRVRAIEDTLSNAVIIPEYMKEVNDPSVANGDTVYGVKAGINAGAFFIGLVLAAPPTSDTDITRYYP